MAEPTPSIESMSAEDYAGVERVAKAMRHVWYSLTRHSKLPEALSGLHKQAFWVLASVSHAPRRMSDLAETTELSSAHITGIVDKLEERGLVERIRSAEDRRVVTVAITPAGTEAVGGAQQAFAERLAEILKPLTDDERLELARLLTKMTEGKVSRD